MSTFAPFSSKTISNTCSYLFVIQVEISLATFQERIGQPHAYLFGTNEAPNNVESLPYAMMNINIQIEVTVIHMRTSV